MVKYRTDARTAVEICQKNDNLAATERVHLMLEGRPLGESRDNVVPAGPPSTQPGLIDHYSQGLLKNGRVFDERILDPRFRRDRR